MRALRSLVLTALIALVAAFADPGPAAAIDTTAQQAILIDASTDTVLLEVNADERMPTSSMSKVLTMYAVFQALEEGRLSLDDTLPVSERAWRMGGSKMFVEINTQVRVEDLIRGVIVQSGNDATVVFAEALAGSEEAFAQQLNALAAELGMTNSHFTNASGWPDPDHYSTVRDLARLAQRMIEDFPDDYEYYSEQSFTYRLPNEGREITQGNRNPLLGRVAGVDGMKTGHTSEAGYGLIATAERDGRRLILVVNGLESNQARAQESEQLLEWGFREFDTLLLYDAGETIATAQVWQGEQDEVPLVVDQDLRLTLPRADTESLDVHIRMVEPVPAPIAAGAQLGTLVVANGDTVMFSGPVYAGAEIGRQGLIGRAWSGLNYLLFEGDTTAVAGPSDAPDP